MVTKPGQIVVESAVLLANSAMTGHFVVRIQIAQVPNASQAIAFLATTDLRMVQRLTSIVEATFANDAPMIHSVSKMMTVQALCADLVFAFRVTTADKMELKLMLTVGAHAHRAARLEAPVSRIRIARLESATCNRLTQGRTWIRIFLDALETRLVKDLHCRWTARVHVVRLLDVAAAPERGGATDTTGNGSSGQERLTECHRTEKLRSYNRWQLVRAA